MTIEDKFTKELQEHIDFFIQVALDTKNEELDNYVNVLTKFRQQIKEVKRMEREYTIVTRSK